MKKRPTVLPAVTCARCSVVFQPRRCDQRWCSKKCKDAHYGALLRAGSGQRGGLSPEARERQRLYWQAKCRRRRAAKRGGVSEPYTLLQIAERDRGRCGLCGQRVLMAAKVPHSKAPTIDHVVPVSEGGDDTRANVQLAHFRCNSVKGARGAQQLALIG
ncbi:HNH endonuclease [Streptomyces sp. NPDC057908]|uniref:HNH endonuclease n=1 Tax=Streptomyces sp. NPDC057908 TaxID=3346276 RepID=UPI0036E952EB